MNDLEHAIKSLKFLHDVEKWSSSEPEEKAVVRRRITKEAIELLKEQEPETSDASKSDSNVGCWYDITHNYTLEQVVSALKSREPRVMTLEEVIESEVGAVVWLEDIDKPIVIAGFVDRVFTGTMVVDFQCVARTVTAGFDDYGKRWRCWTSRPDEKTREAIPWE